MITILHHRSTESSFNCTIFNSLPIYYAYLYVLNGFLYKIYLSIQGVSYMNLLDLLRDTIKSHFPDITPEELEMRIEYAYELLKYIRK